MTSAGNTVENLPLVRAPLPSAVCRAPKAPADQQGWLGADPADPPVGPRESGATKWHSVRRRRRRRPEGRVRVAERPLAVPMAPPAVALQAVVALRAGQPVVCALPGSSQVRLFHNVDKRLFTPPTSAVEFSLQSKDTRWPLDWTLGLGRTADGRTRPVANAGRCRCRTLAFFLSLVCLVFFFLLLLINFQLRRDFCQRCHLALN
jgi:hypothetical protein